VQREQQIKVTVIALLMVGACFITYYFHAVQKSDIVFSHVFYVPIFIATLWWKRKGLLVAVILGLVLIVSNVLFRSGSGGYGDYFRALMFIGAGIIFAILSERISRAEAILKNLNAVLRAIWNVDKIISKRKDRNRLVQDICHSLIQTRGYYSAWIALWNEAGKLIATAEAGVGEDFSAMVELLERGALPVRCREAMKEPGLATIPDPASVCPGCPLSRSYQGRGGMVIRLEHDGKVYGILAATLPVGFAADSEEQALFRGVAGDIARALHGIEVEEVRRQAQEALKESEEWWRALVRNVPDFIMTVDRDGTMRAINHTVPGITTEEAIGTKVFEYVAPEQSDVLRKSLERVFQTGNPEGYQILGTGPRGPNTAWYETRVIPMRHDGEIIAVTLISRDITESRSVEEALRESEEMYRTLLQTSPDAVTVMDLEGKILDVSQRTIELHGFAQAEELLGRSGFDLVSPEDRKRAVKDSQDFMGGKGIMKKLEYRLLKKDGASFVGEVNASWLRDVQGNPKAIILATRDITEHRLAAESLRDSEERYRAFFEQAAESVVLIDPENGALLDFNDMAYTNLGYSREEFQTLRAWSIDVTESAEEVRERLQKILREGTNTYEALHLTKDGGLRNVFVKARLISRRGEKLIQAFWQDITERKRAESELRIKDKALASSISAIALADLAGNLTYVNPSFLKLLRYDEEKEVLGKPAVQFWHPDDKVVEIIRILREQGSWVGEMIAKTKDGLFFHIQLSANMVRDDRERPLYIMVSFIDISERKKMQEHLIQTEKLAAMGILSAGVAHEINTPLGGISMFAQMSLADVGKKGKTDELKDSLDTIIRKSEAAGKVVRNLLEFSRQTKSEMAVVDINSMIERSLILTRNQANIQNVKVSTKLAPDLLPVLADESKIQQVWMNIIINALQAMPKGGKLTITSRNMPVRKMIEVRISDTGVGIPKEVLPKIFDPFFSTKETGKGTGLGLSVSYGIIQEHEGFIAVESEPGKGSTFAVRIPAHNRE